ncbi:MAG: LysE family transporter [Amaricoccus sp.]
MRKSGDGMGDWWMLAALAAANAVNSALPGPCIALTLARTGRGGLASGLAVSAGILAANLCLIAVSFAVLLGLFQLSSDLVSALRWPGAIVMIALGVRTLATALRRDPSAAGPGTTAGGNVAAGLAVGLSSPYNLVFFLALVPIYVPAERLTGPMAPVIVAALLAGGAIAYLGAIGVGMGSRRLAVRGGTWLEGAAAAGLVGFGVLALFAPEP